MGFYRTLRKLAYQFRKATESHMIRWPTPYEHKNLTLEQRALLSDHDYNSILRPFIEVKWNKYDDGIEVVRIIEVLNFKWPSLVIKDNIPNTIVLII